MSNLILNTYGVECPLCFAIVDNRCVFMNGKHRATAHRERVDAAMEARDTAEAAVTTPGPARKL